MKIACIDFDRLAAGSDSRILDLGCGRGQVLIPLAGDGKQVIGADLSATSLAALREDCRKVGPQNSPNVVAADGRTLPFRSDVFDIVLCREMLEHVDSPGQVLTAISSVLKTGGRLCVTVPSKHTEWYFQLINPRWLQMAGHVNVFSRDELTSLLKRHGFEVVEICGENFFYTFFWFIHTIARTEHDGTGRVTEHYRLARLVERMWGRLGNGRLKSAIEKVGNRLLPKSYIYYSVKLEHKEPLTLSSHENAPQKWAQRVAAVRAR